MRKLTSLTVVLFVPGFQGGAIFGPGVLLAVHAHRALLSGAASVRSPERTAFSDRDG